MMMMMMMPTVQVTGEKFMADGDDECNTVM